MTNYSAAQAISPAIERTKQFLFKPFRLGTFLKLTLVALLTEGGMSSCNFNWRAPSGNTGKPSPSFHMPPIHWPSMQVVIWIVALTVLIVIPVCILISYLVIRLRFSYFDCVLRRQHQIAPAWRRYHRQAMRYLGLNLCIGLVSICFMAAAGYALYLHFKPLFQSMGSIPPPRFWDFLPLIATGLLVLFLFALIGFFIETALSYFVLPHMALEDASIRDAVSDVWSDIEAEPWQFLAFIVLRFLLTLVASIASVVALLIALLIVGGAVAVAVLILKTISTTLAVLLGVPAAILVMGLFLLAVIGLGGTVGTFRRNYALLFYGGRYPPLGAILEPTPPLPPWNTGMPPIAPENAGPWHP